jgi:hypothetical protein
MHKNRIKTNQKPLVLISQDQPINPMEFNNNSTQSQPVPTTDPLIIPQQSSPIEEVSNSIDQLNLNFSDRSSQYGGMPQKMQPPPRLQNQVINELQNDQGFYDQRHPQEDQWQDDEEDVDKFLKEAFQNNQEE